MLPNPKTSYKARLMDYDALLAMSDEECCYSLSEREVGIILAQIDYIAWKTRYIVTETEIDQSLLYKWQGNLARKLMSGCCPDDGALFRFAPDGTYQTSTDGGATWTDDPEGDPRNNAIGAPPLPGSGDSTRCAAADNVEGQFKTMRDNLVALLTAGTTVVAIIAGLAGLLGVILGLSGVATYFGVLLIGLAAELLSLTPSSVEDQLSDTVMDTFKCLVYCHMEPNGQMTYDGWHDLLADIDSTFTGFPHTFFFSIVNSMGYIGMSNAGTMGAATASDCDTCSCCEDITVPANAEDGILTDLEFSIGTTYSLHAVGAWDYGTPPLFDANGAGFHDAGARVPGSNVGCLIGSLDGGANWFYLGKDVSFSTSGAPGTLTLAFNDVPGQYASNHGEQVVTVCLNI